VITLVTDWLAGRISGRSGGGHAAHGPGNRESGVHADPDRDRSASTVRTDPQLASDEHSAVCCRYWASRGTFVGGYADAPRRGQRRQVSGGFGSPPRQYCRGTHDRHRGKQDQEGRAGQNPHRG
jgi:hypothetical protein